MGADCFQAAQRFRVGSTQHTTLSDDRGHVPGRSYVKRGVLNTHSVRSQLFSAVVGDFDRSALLSIGISSPVAVARSIVDHGQAT